MFKEAEKIEICGKIAELFLNASAKFAKDFAKVKAIIEKDCISPEDRSALLDIYRSAYHESGKIEGITSFDSSATNCEFCKAMRKAAVNNPAHICNYCYDYAQEHSFRGANIVNRHTLNMLIMSSVEFSREELAAINVSYINRVNSSGDVPNKTYAINMLNIAYANAGKKFAFWAKNKKDVIAACDQIGKPKNVILIQSSPIIGKPDKLAKYFDYVFTVYATREEIEKALNSGAVECNGKKCKDCGYKCYFGNWNSGANIAEYLRVNADIRKKIIG